MKFSKAEFTCSNDTQSLNISGGKSFLDVLSVSVRDLRFGGSRFKGSGTPADGRQTAGHFGWETIKEWTSNIERPTSNIEWGILSIG